MILWRFCFHLASLTIQRGFYVRLFHRVICSLISLFAIVTTRRPVTTIPLQNIKLNRLSWTIVAQEIIDFHHGASYYLAAVRSLSRAAENVQLCFGHIKSLKHPSQGTVKRHERRKQDHLCNRGRRSSVQQPPLGEVMRGKSTHTSRSPSPTQPRSEHASQLPPQRSGCWATFRLQVAGTDHLISSNWRGGGLTQGSVTPLRCYCVDNLGFFVLFCFLKQQQLKVPLRSSYFKGFVLYKVHLVSVVW